jgi:hypothetical protein
MEHDPDACARAQAELMPKEDLTPYRGLWVVLRYGYVIAADLEPRLIWTEENASHEGDVLLAVPWNVKAPLA